VVLGEIRKELTGKRGDSKRKKASLLRRAKTKIRPAKKREGEKGPPPAAAASFCAGKKKKVERNPLAGEG